MILKKINNGFKCNVNFNCTWLNIFLLRNEKWLNFYTTNSQIQIYTINIYFTLLRFWSSFLHSCTLDTDFWIAQPYTWFLILRRQITSLACHHPQRPLEEASWEPYDLINQQCFFHLEDKVKVGVGGIYRISKAPIKFTYARSGVFSKYTIKGEADFLNSLRACTFFHNQYMKVYLFYYNNSHITLFGDIIIQRIFMFCLFMRPALFLFMEFIFFQLSCTWLLQRCP